MSYQDFFLSSCFSNPSGFSSHFFKPRSSSASRYNNISCLPRVRPVTALLLGLPLATGLVLTAPSVLAQPNSGAANNKELAPLVVTADFRHTSVQDLPEATTVVSQAQIQARSAEHLEQMLSLAPNVNFASGSSRGRFYQIRGIGERSQFIDPVNPSVGLFIDGIDMTGLGAAATLFDIDQVEVLRGPQGTRFGANSLGGMINIQSTAPSADFNGYVSGKLGNYNSYGLGAAVGGSLASNLHGRVAVQGFTSDGYMKNRYLDRKDTQDFNEGLIRAKLAWQPSTATDINFTYLHANIDNGYDAFTLDNSRNSLADEPGKDKQKTHAVAFNWQQQLGNQARLETLLSASHSKAVYSFDEDWVYPELHSDTYTSFDAYERTYTRAALDVRLVSAPQGQIFNSTTTWVLGAYAASRGEDLDRAHADPAKHGYTNELDSASASIYGELSSQLSASTRLIYGARAENWRNEFSSNNGVAATTDEWLWGGKLTLEQLVGLDHLAYASYARGYKPGGINSDPDVSAANRTFTTETNNTYELGLKSDWLPGWQTRLAVFYIQRQDQQVKSSYAYNLPNDPVPQFQDYLANAAKGENYGLELESSWQLHQRLLWELSYGYLHTKFKDYSYTNESGVWVDKTGRAQGHAPQHSGSTAFTLGLTSALALRLEAEAKSSFYFSDSHDEQAPGYVLYHARLSYSQPGYEIAFSGRNLTDVATQTRGFGGFGNDPRNGWQESKYVQLGEPRLVLLEGRVNF